MKTLGIITEYNPFHQGHAYMLERAKRKADADRVVVIMSGGSLPFLINGQEPPPR